MYLAGDYGQTLDLALVISINIFDLRGNSIDINLGIIAYMR